MKYCPDCNCLLPDDAHFCMKCMYKYPKAEVVFEREERRKKSKAHIWVISIVLVCVLCLGASFYVTIQMRKKIAGYKAEQAKQKEEWMQQMFRTGADIPYNTDVKYDFRDNLTDFEGLQQMLGEETEEVYEDNEYTVHTFGIVSAYVDDYNDVSTIYIDYTNADEPMKKEYGVYGFNGESTKEEMLKELDTPDQNFAEEEYYFRFDGKEGAPELCAIWDTEGNITALQYFRLF
ncbi:MAG TPA: hypothetical protein DCX82_13490 [Lachnospiraceae bacterium]|nr:hypothetical protein [Lachnospiraceae bacterium]